MPQSPTLDPSDPSNPQIVVVRHRACIRCHKVKTACDGNLPCSRCVRLNVPHECIPHQRSKKTHKKGDEDNYPPQQLAPQQHQAHHVPSSSLKLSDLAEKKPHSQQQPMQQQSSSHKEKPASLQPLPPSANRHAANNTGRSFPNAYSGHSQQMNMQPMQTMRSMPGMLPSSASLSASSPLSRPIHPNHMTMPMVELDTNSTYDPNSIQGNPHSARGQMTMHTQPSMYQMQLQMQMPHMTSTWSESGQQQQQALTPQNISQTHNHNQQQIPNTHNDEYMRLLCLSPSGSVADVTSPSPMLRRMYSQQATPDPLPPRSVDLEMAHLQQMHQQQHSTHAHVSLNSVGNRSVNMQLQFKSETMQSPYLGSNPMQNMPMLNKSMPMTNNGQLVGPPIPVDGRAETNGSGTMDLDELELRSVPDSHLIAPASIVSPPPPVLPPMQSMQPQQQQQHQQAQQPQNQHTQSHQPHAKQNQSTSQRAQVSEYDVSPVKEHNPQAGRNSLSTFVIVDHSKLPVVTADNLPDAAEINATSESLALKNRDAPPRAALFNYPTIMSPPTNNSAMQMTKLNKARLVPVAMFDELSTRAMKNQLSSCLNSRSLSIQQVNLITSFISESMQQSDFLKLASHVPVPLTCSVRAEFAWDEDFLEWNRQGQPHVNDWNNRLKSGSAQLRLIEDGQTSQTHSSDSSSGAETPGGVKSEEKAFQTNPTSFMEILWSDSPMLCVEDEQLACGVLTPLQMQQRALEVPVATFFIRASKKKPKLKEIPNANPDDPNNKLKESSANNNNTQKDPTDGSDSEDSASRSRSNSSASSSSDSSRSRSRSRSRSKSRRHKKKGEDGSRRSKHKRRGRSRSRRRNRDRSSDDSDDDLDPVSRAMAKELKRRIRAFHDKTPLKEFDLDCIVHMPRCKFYPGAVSSSNNASSRKTASASASAAANSTAPSPVASQVGGATQAHTVSTGSSSSGSSGKSTCSCPVVTQRNMVVQVNREFERLLGYTQADLRQLFLRDGQFHAMKRFLYPGAEPDNHVALSALQSLVTGSHEFRALQTVRTKYHHDIQCHVRVQILYTEDGDSEGCIYSITPI